MRLAAGPIPMGEVIPGFACARAREATVTYSPSTILATMSRWISDEPPKMV